MPHKHGLIPNSPGIRLFNALLLTRVALEVLNNFICCLRSGLCELLRGGHVSAVLREAGALAERRDVQTYWKMM